MRGVCSRHSTSKHHRSQQKLPRLENFRRIRSAGPLLPRRRLTKTATHERSGKSGHDGFRGFHNAVSADKSNGPPRSVPPGPRGPSDEGTHRIVKCSNGNRFPQILSLLENDTTSLRGPHNSVPTPASLGHDGPPGRNDQASHRQRLFRIQHQAPVLPACTLATSSARWPWPGGIVITK